MMQYAKAEPVGLRESGFDEKWLSDRIKEDPSILGISLAKRVREQYNFTGKNKLKSYLRR